MSANVKVICSSSPSPSKEGVKVFVVKDAETGEILAAGNNPDGVDACRAWIAEATT